MNLHLAIAFDQNYLQPFCALLASILDHHNGCTLHVVATGVSESTKQEIDAYVSKSGSQIHYYSINDPQLHDFITMSTWTAAVYYRLYFPLLLKNVDRVIYLDSDMIVLKDLVDLYTTPLDGHPVAAVFDNYVSVQPLIGITTPGEYFNSGMLLIDIKLWNDQKISERTMNFLKKFPERIKYVDQCALNAVLYGNWKKLDKNFNLLYSYIPQDASRKELNEIARRCTILHFTLQRPWHMLCKNRLRSLYRYYLQASSLAGGKIILDFSFTKVHTWLFIRLVDCYNDLPLLKQAWRRIKKQHAQ